MKTRVHAPHIHAATITAAIGTVGQLVTPKRKTSPTLLPKFGTTKAGVRVTIDGTNEGHFATLDEARMATATLLQHRRRTRQVQFIHAARGDIVEVWSRSHP